MLVVMKKLFVFALAACSPTLHITGPLLLTEQEPPGDNCAAGGVKIITGLDDNQDGALSEDELTGTPSYLCAGETLIEGEAGINAPGATGPTGTDGTNGADGTDGADGADGEDGADGATGATGAGGIAEGLVPTPTGTVPFRVNYVFFGQTATGLHMDFLDTTNFTVPTGAFNGTGLGNKGIVGFDGFSGRAFNTLRRVEVRLLQSEGPLTNLYMNYLVDTDGNGVWTPPTGASPATDCIVVSNWPAPTNNPSTPDSFALDMETASFGSVSPGSTEACGLPKHTTATGVLATNLTGYDDGTAKLLNTATGDGGMPNGKITPAIMFVANDSSNNSRGVRKVELQELKLIWNNGTPGDTSDDVTDTFDFSAP